MLAALAGALAGCGDPEARRRQGTFGVPDTTTTTDRRRTTEDPTTVQGVDPREGVEVPDAARRAVTSRSGPTRRLVLTERVLTETQQFGRLTAGFLAPPTSEGPARVWIRFTNASEYRRPFEFGPSPPFSHYWATEVEGSNENRAFLLVPDDDRPFPYDGVMPESSTEGRWVGAGRLGTPDGPIDEYRISLDPGESIAGTYSLLVHPERFSLPDRGVYRFDGGYWTEGSLGLSVFDPDLWSTGGTRFDPARTLPSLPGATETRWYHRVAARTPTPATFLEPDAERVRIGEGETELAVENYAPQTVRLSTWSLHKRHGDDWKRIVPWRPRDREGAERTPARPLPPGERSAATLVPVGPDETDPDPYAPGLRVEGVGAGTYAFGIRAHDLDGPGPDAPVTVGQGDRENPFPGDDTVALAALLEFTGPAAAVTPTGDVVDVSTDGTTVTVRVDSVTTSDPVVGPELVVTPVETPDGAVELITEQVNQFPALRNALAAFEEGVSEVRVVTSRFRVRSVLDSLAPEADRLRFVHEGRTFEARADDVLSPD
ncbi:hypothetical protein BRD00_10360 [Halobacteriales archaeon QS_8_69_26]|nr:MAG: hypothetical protein BRD00_10360 [Halobacteriales archaeon QS_8_69_26]